MKTTALSLIVLLGAGWLSACSSKAGAEDKPAPVPAPTPVATASIAPEPAPAAPAAAPAPAAPAGFDPATAPVASPRLGAFPYFSLIDSYEQMTKENSAGSVSKDFLRDVAFDRYEFFDGVKIIPVEGRLMTTRGMGKNASFFQVQKTYERLVKDLGGVTVFEGSGKLMEDLKVKFEEGRHRGRYMLDKEKMGVYLLRTTDREVWVEVFSTWDDEENYWLTVVERKALPMQAAVLPAEALKKELDSQGHVALYLNFDTDQATLRPDAQPALTQVIALLAAHPTLRLTVEGHTDNAGSPTHNQELSEARARTVVATLTAQGISAARLKSAGFGPAKPLADNSTEEGKAKNRRVELVRL